MDDDTMDENNDKRYNSSKFSYIVDKAIHKRDMYTDRGDSLNPYLYMNLDDIPNFGWCARLYELIESSISIEELLDFIRDFVDNTRSDASGSEAMSESGELENASEASEEDQSYNDYVTTSDVLSNDTSDEKIEKKCFNENLSTLEKYTSEPDLFIIKTLNSQNKFEQGFCSTIQELNDYIRADHNSDQSTTLMGIWEQKRGEKLDDMGNGGKVSSKIVFNMPFRMFITLGSLERVLTENQKVWYALPLYGDKRRRIGNLNSWFGMGKNHGQIPGFKIYKLYTKEEITSGIQVFESIQMDYPLVIPSLESGSLQEVLENLTVEKYTKGLLNRLMYLASKSILLK